MLSAVITASLLGIIVLIASNFVLGVLRERKRHIRMIAKQPPPPSQHLDSHTTMAVCIHETAMTAVEKPELVPTFTLSSSWYNRHRTLVSVSFLLMLFLGLFLQSGLADDTLQHLSQNFSIFSAYQSNDLSTASQSAAVTLTASTRLVRVDSAQRNQYYNDYQWHVWSYASCSGISLEEVMNAYGRHLIAADVLQVEQNMGVWDTYNGLTGGEPAMARVANYFGFKASTHPPRTIQDLINVTNKGFPVIVGMPGHIFVVRGGNSNYVYLADSAPANRTVMTHEEFLSVWNGFSVLITPQ